MFRKSLIAVALAGATIGSAHADILGVHLSAYAWYPDIEGSVRSGTVDVDLENDLGFDDDRYTVMAAAFEHPLPLIPNVMLAHTDMATSASNRLERSFDFEGDIYVAGQDVRSELDLSHTDMTLYYEVLDNWISLDAGLTVRRFSEGVSLASSSTSASLDIDQTLPMLYLSARFDLPFSGLYAGADFNGVNYSDNDLVDYRVHLGYVTAIGLGLELGMRTFDLAYDDDDEKADVKFQGAYGALVFRF